MNNEGMMSQLNSLYGFAAYIPCYEGGNSVTAIRKDGQAVLINKGIRSVINNILNESSISLGFIKKNFKEYLGCEKLLPLQVSLSTVLIPVKVRKTIGVNDGSFAYIDLLSIKDVSGDRKAAIKLECGNVIDCLESVRTVRRRMQKGRLMQEKYTSRLLAECGPEAGLPGNQDQIAKVATKGDITMLAYEIMKLRSKIE